MKEIRFRGARARLRVFFLANIGVKLNSDQPRLASGNISERGRRVRELRDEDGYLILTPNDLSDLKPGEYILNSPKPIPAFERSISKETRALVLDRNGFTCQQCGAVAGEAHPYDLTRKTRLQIGHVIDKSQGGSDDPSNLRALCSVCTEGSANLTLDRPSLHNLLVQVRRATAPNQREVLKWLLTRFPHL